MMRRLASLLGPHSGSARASFGEHVAGFACWGLVGLAAMFFDSVWVDVAREHEPAIGAFQAETSFLLIACCVVACALGLAALSMRYAIGRLSSRVEVVIACVLGVTGSVWKLFLGAQQSDWFFVAGALWSLAFIFCLPAFVRRLQLVNVPVRARVVGARDRLAKR